MTRFFVTVFIILLFATFARAQNETQKLTHNAFSLAAEVSLPVALFGQVYSYGAGASAQENFGISKKMALTLYAGYIDYSVKSTYGGGSDGYIPVLGGAELNLSSLLYASLQTGITFRTHDLGNAFTFSPGIGFKISRNFTALVKYVGQTRSAINSSSVGLRAAYVFGK